MCNVNSKVGKGIPVHCAHDKLVDLAKLVPNPRNPNKHSERQVQLLAGIIAHQGWRSPVVVSERSGFIVSGHGRFEAAKLLGVRRVPVNFQDFPTDADELAHLLADNKIAEFAEMDFQLASEILRGLQGTDITLTGFEAHEIENLLKADWSPPAIEEGTTLEPGQSDGVVVFELNSAQKATLDRALAKVRAGDDDASDADCLEIICSAFVGSESPALLEEVAT